MTLSSFLVVGAGEWALAVADALAARTAEVSLIAAGSAWHDEPAAARLRARGADLRLDLALIGVMDVGTHVEAELSDGGVENYDAVVIADAGTADRLRPLPRAVSIPEDGADPDREAERLMRAR